MCILLVLYICQLEITTYFEAWNSFHCHSLGFIYLKPGQITDILWWKIPHISIQCAVHPTCKTILTNMLCSNVFVTFVDKCEVFLLQTKVFIFVSFFISKKVLLYTFTFGQQIFNEHCRLVHACILSPSYTTASLNIHVMYFKINIGKKKRKSGQPTIIMEI